ncbi:MAG TPA: hypothetical protein VHW09_19460 [Bryobacteraceae bacterium]|jgi:hypothetical protein|nr:hypothetical protein [Bryobacteraceae bacterium]
MNGRTCQLCGKALSRFTVGSGGDFCSREHRNQFRLRLGMDRLMEANKVASLMRRRENAKAIPAAQLVRDCKALPRLAPLLRMPVRELGMRPLPLRSPLAVPSVVARSIGLHLAPEAATPMRAEVRSAEPRAFPIRPKRLLPPRGASFRARITPAGAVPPRLDRTRLAQLRREVTELRLNLRRANDGGSGIQVKPLRIPGQHWQEALPAVGLHNSADRGRDLRVSSGVGFRLMAPRVRSIEFARLETNPPQQATDPRRLTAGSPSTKSEVLAAGVIRFTVRLPSGPRGPKHKNGTGFEWPNAVLHSGRPVRNGVSITRACDVRWGAPPPVPPQFRQDSTAIQFYAATPAAPRLPAPPVRGAPATRRASLVAFHPQETPFQCPSDLHGTLLSSMHFGAAPVRKVETRPATLEEHFDSGLDNWVGGTADWKVDVAGVRPGSLALYSPSLDICDCMLEFLTRIEQRGISWVFRAANYKDYYQATLALAPGGGYELRRTTVIGGLAEGATVRTVPSPVPAANTRTAVTVRTRVAGNEFTVSLDGQVIDTWTDARLTGGGIGFVGAPEERARLYWVKVTPIGQLSKEYLKR